MSKQQHEQSVLDLIEQSRAATRELREAMADAKARERQFKQTIDEMRAEMVQYSQKLARQLVDELVKREFQALNAELQKLVVDVEKLVRNRAGKLFEQYMQQEIDDAPSVDQMFEARRTLARWQKAWGALPISHQTGHFTLEVGEPQTVNYETGKPYGEQKG